MTSTDIAEGLPAYCYGTHPTDGALILLKRGESGYWPTEGYRMGPFSTWDQVADFLNKGRGVTRAQRSAMEAGSLFGWDVPGADPRHYNTLGRFVVRLVTGTA